MSTMLTARLTTESGWHSIRGLTIEHNARRFRKHVERLGREPEMRRFMRATRLKKRIRAMSIAARTLRSQHTVELS